MIEQELIDQMESDIKDFGAAKYNDVKRLLSSYKQMIEGNANLHRECSYLRLNLDKIAKSDPGASGNLARLTLKPYEVAQKQ